MQADNYPAQKQLEEHIDGTGAVQDISSSGTITLPRRGELKRVSASGGAASSVILARGVAAGQRLILINTDASNAITFATAATSYVADGTSGSVAALRALLLVWDNKTSRWYRTG